MSDYFSIKHSFNMGDLICILPGLKQIHKDTGKKVHIYQRLGLAAFYYDNQINSTVNKDGDSVCMNMDLFERLKPLIEYQSYIESFQVWEGETVDLDYDMTRDRKSIPMPYGDIHTWGEAVFPQTSCNLAEAWLEVGDTSMYSTRIIINRTMRYINPYVTYHFLKPYQDNLVFSGTSDEHKDFCDKNGLDIKPMISDDFLELAKIISKTKFGIYNQSFHWHLADALKVPRVLEVCAMFPNTFATGASGYHSFNQQSLEYFFHKLINA